MACKCMFCTHRVHIQNNSMQAKGLQHAPDSKLWQSCPSCGAVGIVTIWAPDDHSKAWGDRNMLNQSVNLALNNLKIYLQWTLQSLFTLDFQLKALNHVHKVQQLFKWVSFAVPLRTLSMVNLLASSLISSMVGKYRSRGIPPFSSYRNSTVCLAMSTIPIVKKITVLKAFHQFVQQNHPYEDYTSNIKMWSDLIRDNWSMTLRI